MAWHNNCSSRLQVECGTNALQHLYTLSNEPRAAWATGQPGRPGFRVMQRGCQMLCGWMMCSHSCISLSLACCAEPHASGKATAPHSKGQVCDACCSIYGVPPLHCPAAGGADKTAMAQELRQHLLSMVSYKVRQVQPQLQSRQLVLGAACSWAYEGVAAHGQGISMPAAGAEVLHVHCTSSA